MLPEMIEHLRQVLHVVMFQFGNTLMVMLQLLLCNLEPKLNAKLMLKVKC